MAQPFNWIRDKLGLSDGSGDWPPGDLKELWEDLERFAAFRKSDSGVLKQIESIEWRDRYMISPVPRMISGAKAHLLYGEPATYTAASERDQERLDYIVTQNDLDTESQRGVKVSSSEGEVWGRILVRPDLLDVPIIELESRRSVIPHFSGRFVIGATFVCEWAIGEVEVMRLFESYEPGVILAALFRGTRNRLGNPYGLDQFPPTAGMAPVIETGVPAPLCAFIPNSLDSNPTRGFSDYQGLEERFLGINRATTIGDSNTELAGKKRALLDAEYTGPGGTTNLGDDVFIRTSQQSELGAEKPLQMLEYGYDASQITQWLDHLIDSTLTFGGAAPQLVGRQLDGAAVSGTALRLKMVHSLLEASGSGRYQDKGYTRLLHYAQMLDSRPVGNLGFGRKWSKPDEKPTVERGDALPRDDQEAAAYVATLVGAEAISIEERLAFLHPEWTEDQITEEKARLDAEAKAKMPVIPPGFGDFEAEGTSEEPATTRG